MMADRTYALSTGGDLFSGGDEEARNLFERLRAVFSPDLVELRVDLHSENRRFRVTGNAEPGSLRIDRDPGFLPPAPEGALTLQFEDLPQAAVQLILVRRVGPPFSPADRACFRQTSPLVEQAIRQTLRIARVSQENRILLTVCDSSDTSILLFDDRQQIIYANNRADELLSRQTEELLAVSLTEDQAVTFLSFLLESVPKPGVPATRLSAEKRHILLTDGTRFDLTVTPLAPRSPGAGGVHYLVMLREMRRFEMEKARPGLREAGLSDREIEVVGLLLLGLKNAEIAERLRISGYTVKDHLKHVFHKLGLRSRSELVSQVLQLSG